MVNIDIDIDYEYSTDILFLHIAYDTRLHDVPPLVLAVLSAK